MQTRRSLQKPHRTGTRQTTVAENTENLTSGAAQQLSLTHLGLAGNLL